MNLSKSFNFYASISLLVVLAGCASSSSINVVGDSLVASNLSIDSVTVTNSTGENFDGADVIALMRSATEDQVMKKNLKRPMSGTSYNLEIDIVQYSKGNAVARWMLPGAGKTILSVEARLKDNVGAVIAESQATESIGAGGLYTIGAWKRVFDKVANSLVTDIAGLVNN